MGMAIGAFERAQLLLYAFQGLNANNMVYDLVKENGKTGTIGTVVQSLSSVPLRTRSSRQARRASPSSSTRPRTR